jgi:hypothetical protein
VQHIGFPFGQRRIAVRQRLGGERRVNDPQPLVLHPAHRVGELPRQGVLGITAHPDAA